MINKLAPPLTVSIVVYHLDQPVLQQALASLAATADHAANQGLLSTLNLYLIDNSEEAANRSALKSLGDCFQSDRTTLQIISGHGNVGYGRGHNLAIGRAESEHGVQGCYLILNPDVIMAPDALTSGLQWLASQQRTVAVAPAITDGSGNRASSCKRYPSVLDFLLRGFAPGFVKKLFARRLAHYDMNDLPADRPSDDIPVISGCFMLFRFSALRDLRGFDPNYFLYFEDFDLSLRAHRLGSLTYLPMMRITHLGGHSAKKGLRHITMFSRSALRFFNTHGWRWL
ncbi:glycosyltransferase [Pseudohongiella spirulinae]|uniref:glycosyltransferase n=1 Tax=Pseudohongiella spirulinae TaxID=1249552 RepID=UPI00146FEA6F|nr:glycosyltransferase family 2 protein [Pseudohongiella spirulinae]